jgi:DNA-binding GntR family transcriptional regulator
MNASLPDPVPASGDRPADRAQVAYDSLRSAIIEAALPPGTRLGEDMLGAHFGVSRTLIRAALARLTSEGLVDTGKGKSAQVASPTQEEARDTFAVRRALEREVIGQLSGSLTPVTEQHLRAHVAAEVAALGERDTQRSGRLAAEFHIELARACGNVLLQRYVAELVSRTALILAIYGRELDQAASLTEHEQLIDLLVAGRREDAIALVEGHLSSVEHRALSGRASEENLDVLDVLRRY